MKRWRGTSDIARTTPGSRTPRLRICCSTIRSRSSPNGSSWACSFIASPAPESSSQPASRSPSLEPWSRI